MRRSEDPDAGRAGAVGARGDLQRGRSRRPPGLLGDDARVVRLVAAYSLGVAGDRSALPALTEAAKRERWTRRQVYRNARRELRRIASRLARASVRERPLSGWASFDVDLDLFDSAAIPIRQLPKVGDRGLDCGKRVRVRALVADVRSPSVWSYACFGPQIDLGGAPANVQPKGSLCRAVLSTLR